MPNSSRLSSGCRSARWISVVPFDWMPIAIPDPDRHRAVVADERDVGASPHAHDARRAAGSPYAVEERAEHLGVRRAR